MLSVTQTMNFSTVDTVSVVLMQMYFIILWHCKLCVDKNLDTLTVSSLGLPINRNSVGLGLGQR